ncbi:MAG TPA: urea carboxylase-associated family protein [Paracoccaceae bacterium]|nr:urea carboxylase-associated family protein [Paracoccaceae bacterium]
MITEGLSTIPARKGVADRLSAGECIDIVNTHGSQVIDTWAFSAEDMNEFMSMEHSRGAMLRLNPNVGDTLLTNRRRPILTFVEDTSGGVHDTLIAACDRYRYQLLGCTNHHDNCTDNLAEAVAALGLRAPETPSPLNLFMNIPVHADGAVSFEPPVSEPGSHVRLRAEMDLIIVFSACPQDMVPINGVNCTPTDAHYRKV